MIEFVTLTGEMHEGHIGCSYMGRNFYAKPVLHTAFQSVPGKKWLKKYAKEFFGVVGYVTDQLEKPILLGVVPIKQAKYKEPIFEDSHFIRSEKYSVEINDKDSTFSITGPKVSIKIDDAKDAFTLKTSKAEISINATGLVSIKNNQTSLKKVLTGILKTYLKTKTIDGKPLSPDSLTNATKDLIELSKLLF